MSIQDVIAEGMQATYSAPSTPDFLNKLPALRLWLMDIGASVRALRRAVIKRKEVNADHDYWREVCNIKWTVGEGATLAVSSPEYEPAADTRAEIIDELCKAELPRSIATTLGRVDLLCKQKLHGISRNDPNLFICMSRDGKDVLHVQHRVETDDGKVYMPWTCFSNGDWYCAEPDDALPLYNLDKLKFARRVMIHEGPKAARYCTWLNSDDPEAKAALDMHPWKDAIAGAAHLGWMGGAQRPLATDWEPIKRLPREKDNKVEVFLVCDADDIGERAAPKISRALLRPLTVVRFDYTFRQAKMGFDLADLFPSQADDGRYDGPSFRACCFPGTWATTMVQNEDGEGRPTAVLRSEFVDEWWSVVQPRVYVHKYNLRKQYATDQFNASVAPFSDAANVAKLMLTQASAQVDTLAYAPNKSGGRVHTDEELSAVNLFMPPNIRPVAGDREPWLDFIKHLFPEPEDRHEIMRWCATLIARPDVKMTYGVLLISETQGVGKGTLCEKVLAPLVGWHNVSMPNEQTVTKGNFTDWLAQKRLVIIHEIYAGRNHKAYDKVKSLITDRRVRCEKKYQDGYDIDNWAHFVACSNSVNALKLADDDRRWLVPRVTERKREPGYWRNFNHWLERENGLGIIMHWAQDFLQGEKAHVVREGQHAPATTYKAEVIEVNWSPGYRMAYELGRSAMDKVGEERVVYKMADVKAWVYGNLTPSDFKDPERSLRKAMVAAGMKTVTHEDRIKIAGERCYVVANFDIPKGVPWSELEAFKKVPF